VVGESGQRVAGFGEEGQPGFVVVGWVVEVVAGDEVAA